MRWIKRLLWLFLICVLLLSNIITVVSSTLSNAISGVLGATLGRKLNFLPRSSNLRLQLERERAESRRLARLVSAQKTSIARLGNSAVERTRRLAMYNIAESTIGNVPMVGVTVLVAGTVWELSQLCEGLNELNELYEELEIETEIDSGVMSIVCRTAMPPRKQQEEPLND